MGHNILNSDLDSEGGVGGFLCFGPLPDHYLQNCIGGKSKAMYLTLISNVEGHLNNHRHQVGLTLDPYDDTRRKVAKINEDDMNTGDDTEARICILSFCSSGCYYRSPRFITTHKLSTSARLASCRHI
jgi:hypothetical protein